MAVNRLSPLQREFLTAFFAREDRFYLTGGAALVGFYLGHRETHDLDLFNLGDTLDEGQSKVAAIARGMGASLESIQTSPDFRRMLLKRGGEGVVIDLVRERVPQLAAEKPVLNGIRVDPPEEILANKLCNLLSRAVAKSISNL